MAFTSTRAYHDAKHAWIASMLSTTTPLLGGYTEQDLEPDTPSFTLCEMDTHFRGKQGVFYTYGNSMYYHRQVKHGGPMVGFARLITPHVGTLYALVDDLQGLASGGTRVTMDAELTLLPGLELSPHVDFGFTCQATSSSSMTKRTGGAGVVEEVLTTTTTTRTLLELVDLRTNQVVAKSSGTFTNAPKLIDALVKDMDSVSKQKQWERVAYLRLAGEHPADPRMSFRLTVPKPVVTLAHEQQPSWWEDIAVSSVPALNSPFDGRFELFNVQKLLDGVRALGYSQVTAEGAPLLFHGGASVSGAIEVLHNLHPSLQIEHLQVKYKRPIKLENKFVIEWKKAKDHQNKWTAQILDWSKKVMQEIVLVETSAKL